MLLALAMSAAACSSDDDADGAATTVPDTTEAPQTTASASTDDTTPETTAPTATSAPAETTATTTASTTTAPEPAASYVVIGSLVIGAHDGDGWVPVDLNGDEAPGLAGETIRGSDGDEVAIAAVEASCFPEIDFANWFAYQESGYIDDLGVRTNAAHDAWPRPIAEVSVSDTHGETVRSWLDGRGFTEHEAVVRSVYRLDLDGDGAEEVLIEAGDGASEMQGFYSPPGSYSALLMRRVAGNDVEIVDVGSHLPEAEIVEGWEEVFPDGAVPGLFITVEDFVDVDGDGTYELVSSIDVHEGYTASLHTLGATPEVVLETGCGV